LPLPQGRDQLAHPGAQIVPELLPLLDRRQTYRPAPAAWSLFGQGGSISNSSLDQRPDANGWSPGGAKYRLSLRTWA
jgi:hypothetical protein